jgi:hypothetical protein
MELVEMAVLMLMPVLRQLRFVRSVDLMGNRVVLCDINKIPKSVARER